MAYEAKDLTGSLFKNDRKEKDTHADYRGSVLIDGSEYWLDAWINESNSGTKYMSLKFKLKDQQQPSNGQRRPQPAAFDTDLDDDVPF
jgi:uncharacterized protein (DUF736 family)